MDVRLAPQKSQSESPLTDNDEPDNATLPQAQIGHRFARQFAIIQAS